MYQKDMERYAFLYLCGQQDQDLLNGRIRMTFQDFYRLIYITETLGFGHLNLEIWNKYSSQYKDQLQALERMNGEFREDVEFGEYRDDGGLRDKWAADFCEAAPSEEARKLLEDIFNVFHEDGN